MSKKISENKTYIAVEIPENVNNTTNRRSKFLNIFKRKEDNKTPDIAPVKTSTINKSDLKRLFSLAAPEKWKLMGKFLLKVMPEMIKYKIIL